MNRIAALLSVLTISASAMPLKYGIDLSGIVLFPQVDLNAPPGMAAPSPEIESRYGVRIGFATEASPSEQFSVRGSIGYEFASWGISYTEDQEQITFDAKSHFLSLVCDAIVYPISKVQTIAGLGVDIPLSAKGELGHTINGKAASVKSGDLKDPKTQVFLEAGLGYKTSEDLGVNIRYRYPIAEYLGTSDLGTFRLPQLHVGVFSDF